MSGWTAFWILYALGALGALTHVLEWQVVGPRALLVIIFWPVAIAVSGLLALGWMISEAIPTRWKP